MAYPESRTLRTRRTSALRRLAGETRLSADDLIQPLLVAPASGQENPVGSVAGIAPLCSAETAAQRAAEAWRAGIPAVLLHARPQVRDATGSRAFRKKGLLPGAVAAIAERCPDIAILCDLDLSGFTDHGHPGAVEGGRLDNDASLDLAARFASCLAKAGATGLVAGGGLDGVVGFVRETLDEDGYEDVVIVGESASYDSALRHALDVALDRVPVFGDRSGYRLDVRNSAEAVREASHDEEEGADILLVTPAGPSLDVIRALREQTELTVAAYQSLGELAMIEAAAKAGVVARERALMEAVLVIRRAGADVVVTHAATEIATRLLS